jgi:hypothetical protein
MTVNARWATKSGPSRLRATIAVENFGDAVALSAGGDPPALLTTMSRRPWRARISSTSRPTASASRTSA